MGDNLYLYLSKHICNHAYALIPKKNINKINKIYIRKRRVYKKM